MSNPETKISIETAEDEVHSFNEYKAVEQALQPYIKAASSGDGALARTAFFDHARIVGTMNGDFLNNTADEFGANLTEFGPSPETKHHIAWINISGPAAAARVEFVDWYGYRFTDFFVLFKTDGQWKISGKVYNTHSKN